MKRALLFCSLLALSSAATAEDAIYIAAGETQALEAKEGQKITVHGTISGSGKSSSGTNFVNFEGAEFYLVTFKSDLTQFPDGEPSDLYEGKRVAVTGTISIYREKPQIKLTSPDQVEIIDPEAEFPPAPMKTAEPAPENKASASSPKPEKPAEESKTGKPKPPVDSSRYFKK